MTDRIGWKKGSRHRVKAEDAYGEIERIREQSGGLVTPQAIVDESVAEDAVLHPEFEWDNATAANEFRKEQARSIVQNLRIVSGDGDHESSAPALISVVIEQERGYQPASVIFDDADSTEFVIREAFEALRAWQKRYESLRSHKALSRVWDAIEGVAETA